MPFGKGERDNDPPYVQHKSSSPPNDTPCDPSKPSKRQNLPPSLQRIIDEADENEAIYDDYWAREVPGPKEPAIRYAAYASRIRTLLYSMERYVAYTSDISEPLRPLALPYLVPGAYAISWSYILGDAAHESHKASCYNKQVLNSKRLGTPGQGAPRENTNKTPTARGVSTTKISTVPVLEDHRTVAMQRILFHSMASMALPAFTIRHIVKYTNKAMKDVKSKVIRTSGPIRFSLSIMSVFPYVFDKPVEDAVEWIFYKTFKQFGGQEAVGDALQIGRRKQLRVREAKLLKDNDV